MCTEVNVCPEARNWPGWRQASPVQVLYASPRLKPHDGEGSQRSTSSNFRTLADSARHKLDQTFMQVWSFWQRQGSTECVWLTYTYVYQYFIAMARWQFATERWCTEMRRAGCCACPVWRVLALECTRLSLYSGGVICDLLRRLMRWSIAWYDVMQVSPLSNLCYFSCTCLLRILVGIVSD